MRPIEHYYLDESGSTGDLINAGDALDFAKQPIFTLACLGIDDLEALGYELERLKKVHKVQSPELKSKSLRNKPCFAADLISYLNKRDLPIMIEIVEKRFFICATMVSCLILPAVGPVDLEPCTMFIRKVFAEFLCDYMPDGIIQNYIEACDGRSLAAVGQTYDHLLSWLNTFPQAYQAVAGIKRFTEDSQSDFLALSGESTNDWNGLPIPDDSKAGNPFWILPNLSSFTNIYARLNLRHGGQIGKLKLFHDEQTQFDQIIRSGKLAAEKLASANSVPKLAHVNYSFSQSARLDFIRSDNNPGIQAADVLAGFAMRYVQDALLCPSPMTEPCRATFQMLRRFNAAEATGCNLLMTAKRVNKL